MAIAEEGSTLEEIEERLGFMDGALVGKLLKLTCEEGWVKLEGKKYKTLI